MQITPGEELSGHCYIVNRGAYRARIKTDRHNSPIRARILIYWGEGPIPQKHVTGDDNYEASVNVARWKRQWIDPGDAIRWDFTSKGRTLSEEQVAQIKAGTDGLRLYVIGLIRFGDDLDINRNDAGNHRTLFCRQYCPDTDRYEPVDDSYYEYQS